jgi:hypothetical protein
MKIFKNALLAITLHIVFFSSIPALANGSGWKIAIIDTGLMDNHPNISSRINDQLCWSENDDKTSDSTNATTGYVHYDIASTCPNGAKSNLTSSNSGTVPRKTEHNFSAIYDYHYFGARHGSTVLNEARFLASGARFIVVNNSYYSQDNKTFNSNGDVADCGYHGPNGNDSDFPDRRKPSDLVGCYDPSDAEKQTSIINAIKNRGNVAAINYSASKTESCNNNNAIFRDLKDSNIAFVASAGNGGPSGNVKYPACNPNVISVGALKSRTDLTVAPSTSLQGKIDFFADGRGADYLANSLSSPQTSYAAPKVAAAFAVMKSSDSFATLDEMKFALRWAAPSCIQHRGDCVPIVTDLSIQDAADCLKFGTCRPNLPPGGGDIDYDDGGQYGSIYGDDSSNYVLEIDFSDFATNASASVNASASKLSSSETQNQTVALSSNITVPDRREVVLSFDGKMSSNHFYKNGFNVYINNVRREGTGYFANEKSFEYILHRNFFNTGNNTIRIEPISTNTERPWGLSNIKAEFTPVVPLTLGQTDTSEYGYDDTQKRYTGMRASFDLTNTNNDVLLSMIGWDIDTADEISVFINGSPLGNLTQGAGSSDYSPRDYFLLTKNLLNEGTNIIELVQRETDGNWTGYQDEKWAVKDLRVQIANPDLTVPTVSIVDRSLKFNVPFSVSATVRNVGTGSSSASTATFHISADENITTSDSQVKSLPVGALLPNANANLNTTIQTSLVNQDYYLGVCVNSVVGETSSANNCSAGVPLKSTVVIAPIIMLLLGDD